MLQNGKQHYRRQKTMTLLNSSSGYSGTSCVRKSVRSIGRRFFNIVNGWVAAFLAQREYQATLVVLRSFSDRELRDMGLDRGQIGPALEDAARYRASRQHSKPLKQKDACECPHDANAKVSGSPDLQIWPEADLYPTSASGHETDMSRWLIGVRFRV